MTNRKEKNRNMDRSLLRGVLVTLLTYAPMLLSMGILLLSRGTISRTILSLSTFLAGFSGVIIIIRKESPSSFWSVRGKGAVIQGAILIVFFWGSALLILTLP